MKCKKCGNNLFYAKQIVKAYVTVDENGKFYSNLPGGLENALCAAKKPFGPYQCTRCGEMYDTLEDIITTVYCGEEKIWNSREEALAYFSNMISKVKGAERNRCINIYMELKKGHNYCTDTEKSSVVPQE